MNGLEIIGYRGEGYHAPFRFEGWRVAFLNYAERFTRQGMAYLERHKLTDEVFVLLEGQATLLMGEDAAEVSMNPGQLYVVKQDAWHNIQVSEDAKVLIIENADTGRENTEYMEFRHV